MSEYDDIESHTQPVPATTSFTGAIDRIAKGHIMRRQSWSDDETVIALNKDILSIYIPSTKVWHPLLISLGDMQGEDWVIGSPPRLV